MPLDPEPLLSPPTVRQQTVVQNSSPAREIAVNLPLVSLSSSRVLVVIITTISGGAKSHIPSSQIWQQLPLIGAGGYAQFGNTLVSAWISRAGSTVYSAGSFKFAGLVGLSPEYCTVLAFELEDTQTGDISLSQQTWDTSYSNSIEAQSPAVGQKVRGVLAVGYSEGQKHFLQPNSPQNILTQTAASGFFAAPFSMVGSYAGQSSNDPSDVVLPFEGVASRSGILLFSVVAGDTSINSPEKNHGVNAFLSYPGSSFSTSSMLGYGSTIATTADAYISFDPMTVMESSDAMLFGATSAFSTLGTQVYAAVTLSGSTDAALDVFTTVSEDVSVNILGPANETITGDTIIVFGQDGLHTADSRVLQDLFHLTDAYLFAGQTSHLTDTLLQQQNSLTHTTTALAVALGSSSITSDGYLAALVPPSGTHTTDANLTQDNIIGMTGWELQGDFAECDASRTPNYSLPPGTIAASTSAKRPGSQGSYGLRIDNTTGSDAYWVPPQTSKSLLDLQPTIDWPAPAASVFSEMWTSFNFRCLDRPAADSEMLIADYQQTISFVSGHTITLLPGYSYWIMLGNRTDSGTGGALQLGVGSLTVGGGVVATHLLSDTSWHYMEVRTYSTSGVALSATGVTYPLLIEVYLDGDLVMSTSSTYTCLGIPTLGMQERRTVERFRVDYDDLVISTNRLNQFDLSVIAKPAKDEGTYTAWTGTPSNTYTDVASIPYDAAKHFDSSAANQRRTVKVYSGGDTDPYPGVIHAVSMQAVHVFNASSAVQNMALMIREGSTDLVLRSYYPTTVGGKGTAALTVTTTKSPVAGDNWVDAIYDFEVGVKQLIDANANRVVGISVNMLVSPFSYSHTADAMLFGAASISHTTTSFLGRSSTHDTDALITDAGVYHYVDSSPVGLIDGTHTTSSATAGEASLSFTADAFLDKSLFQTTDAVIVSVRGSVHAADAGMIGQIDGYQSTDAIIGALVDKPHSTDALPYFMVESYHLTDARALATYLATHLTNARMKAAVIATHTSNGVLKAIIAATHTTSAVKYLRVDTTHLTSSAKLGVISGSFTTSSAMAPTNVVAQFHTAISTLKKTFTATETTDTFLKIATEHNFTTNAIRLGSSQGTHSADARIVIPTPVTLTHNTNSAVSGTVSSPITTNTLLKKTFTLTGTTDAKLELVKDLTHAANSLLSISPTHSHSVNAVMVSVPTLTATTDTLLRSTYVATHTTNSAAYGTVDRTITADSDLFGAVSSNHTVNALLKSDIAATFTTTAYLSFEKLFSTNSYIAASNEKFQAIASSLFGQAQALHTTSVVVYAQLDQSHLTSSSVLGNLTVTALSSSDLYGAASAVFTTNSLAATESLHSGNSALFGATSAGHSSDALLVNDDLGIFEQEPGTMFEGAF